MCRRRNFSVSDPDRTRAIRLVGLPKFPSIPVEVRARVVVSRGRQFVIAEQAWLTSQTLGLVSKSPLPLGSLVDLEFTLDGDAHPYVGEARTIACREAGDGVHVLEFEFARIRQNPMGARDRLREWNRLRRIAGQLVVDGYQYAVHSAKGNELDEKDFGEPGAGHRRPILLIHGFLGTRGAMLLTERRLKERGYPIFSVELGWLNVADISRSAMRIAEKVERIRAKHNLDRIDILGHSMGGLIGLMYVKHFGGADHVRKMVTVGAPFHGARLARAALIGIPVMGLWAQSLWQIVPDSRFLAELTAPPLPPGVEIACIIAKNDSIVSPRSCALEGARNIMIATNHAGLVVSPRVFARVEEEFRSRRRDPAREPVFTPESSASA